MSWTELERFTRKRVRPSGKTENQRCVRVRCACGSERVMTTSEFDWKRSGHCNRCRLRRTAAEGWAHSRRAREGA